MNIFVAILPVLMGCHGNHSFKLLNGFIIEEHSFLSFDCLIEPFGIKKKYFYEFNAGLINHLGSSLCIGFVLIFKFSLIFMNMQMR